MKNKSIKGEVLVLILLIVFALLVEQVILFRGLSKIKDSEEVLVELTQGVQGANTYDDAISHKVSALSATLGITSILVMALCAVLIWYVGRYVVKPLQMFTKSSEQFANGNLDGEFEGNFKYELKVLQDAFNTSGKNIKQYIEEIERVLNEINNYNLNASFQYEFSGNFKQIQEAINKHKEALLYLLNEIGKTAKRVNSSSEQVSSSAISLSQGATEQASSVDQLSTTIGEVTTQVQDNAKNAEMSLELSGEVEDALKEAIGRIDDMKDAVHKIEVSSGEIQKITKAIEDIAFQTNILSLNAAVEAARAGKAGTGFAVVADEVRNLAAKAATSAKQTSTLISNTIDAVKLGKDSSDAVVESVNNVKDRTDQTTDIIHTISDACYSQAKSLNEIKSGIEQVAAVVQTTSATSEENAAASEELTGQARLLDNMVDKFKF